jgi:zinc transporter ZupT
MSQADPNAGPRKVDRALLKSSQILTKTFHGNQHNPDLEFLVNPVKSDYHKLEPAKINTSEAVKKVAPSQHIHEPEDVSKSQKVSNAVPYLLLVALCIDGFFEGIALGIQSGWEKVLFVAISLVINKLAVALGLGIIFKKSGTEIQTFIRFIILFSVFCPFGIVLGYILTDNQLASPILLGISAGTFIYVSCSVVIVEEFAITRYRYSKYSFFFLGGALTAGIAIVGSEYLK